jgi:hypothetical protein
MDEEVSRIKHLKNSMSPQWTHINSKQRQVTAAAVILLTALTTGLSLYVHRLMTNGDNLDYLLISWLARTRDVLEPFKWRFPVGYPYLLSLWLELTGQRAGGEMFTLSAASVTSAKFFGICLIVPAFLAMTLWLRQVKASFPFLLGLLLATSQVLMVQFSIIGAEPAFISCSFFALMFWERLVHEDHPSWTIWLGLSYARWPHSVSPDWAGDPSCSFSLSVALPQKARLNLAPCRCGNGLCAFVYNRLGHGFYKLGHLQSLIAGEGSSADCSPHALESCSTTFRPIAWPIRLLLFPSVLAGLAYCSYWVCPFSAPFWCLACTSLCFLDWSSFSDPLNWKAA